MILTSLSMLLHRGRALLTCPVPASYYDASGSFSICYAWLCFLRLLWRPKQLSNPHLGASTLLGCAGIWVLPAVVDGQRHPKRQVMMLARRKGRPGSWLVGAKQ